MEIDVIRQLEELVRAFGVKLMRMDNRMTEETALMEFDQGLRRFLGYPYEIERGFRMMEKHYKEKILYLVRDSFEEHYMSFRIPEEHCSDGRQEFIQIGPYIMSNPEEIVERVIERLGLAPYLSEELKEYYYSVPILADSDALQGVVLTQLGYLCCAGRIDRLYACCLYFCDQGLGCQLGIGHDSQLRLKYHTDLAWLDIDVDELTVLAIGCQVACMTV